MEKCDRCGHTKDEHFIIGGCQYENPMRPFDRCLCDGFVHKQKVDAAQIYTNNGDRLPEEIIIKKIE